MQPIRYYSSNSREIVLH